ncbi:hypothetical protein BDW75DRAFT_238148 [Aspergillus navahoensis]
MPKLLQKMKDVMAISKPKSDSASRGPDSKDYGDEHDAYTANSSGDRAYYVPYRVDDYGLRFGSYEGKPRPGTYGSGSYSSSTHAKDYGSSSNAGRPGSYADAGEGPGFSGDAVGSGSYNRGSGYRNGWPYGHDYRGQKGFMPIDREQRSSW